MTDTAITFDIEPLIQSAQEHGAATEIADHEVGDLQEYLRAMWTVLSPAQKEQFFKLDAVVDTYCAATGEDEDHLAALVRPKAQPKRRAKP